MNYIYSGTIQDAAQEIVQEIKTKLEYNTQASIGFFLSENGTAFVGHGFSCYNSEPEIILFNSNCGEEVLGEVPYVEEWDDEIVSDIVTCYAESWIKDELISHDVCIEFLKHDNNL